MSLYQTIWKNEKNRTLLISSIIAIGTLIVAIIFASLNYDTAGFLRIWYFVDQDVRHYSWGLVIAEILLLSLFYFFMLIALATLSEIRANLPSWGTFITSAIIAILATWLITSIHPRGGGLPTNFTPEMQWTIFGVLIVIIIASIFYIFFTDEERAEKAEKAEEKKQKSSKKKKAEIEEAEEKKQKSSKKKKAEIEEAEEKEE